LKCLRLRSVTCEHNWGRDDFEVANDLLTASSDLSAIAELYSADQTHVRSLRPTLSRENLDLGSAEASAVVDLEPIGIHAGVSPNEGGEEIRACGHA